jgi:hypothetical protein
MKTDTESAAVPEGRQRRPAQLAERELQHLELILSSFNERDAGNSPLPAGYWDMRVAQLDAEYELVPAQCQRVANLQRKLALLEAALENASRQDSERVDTDVIDAAQEADTRHEPA